MIVELSGSDSTGSARLRRAGANDAGTLSELASTAFHQAYRDAHSLANLRAYCAAHYSTAAFEALLADPAVDCVVATRAGVVCGYYLAAFASEPPSCVRADDAFAADAELRRIYVLAHEYGSGLAAQLYTDACARMCRAGRDRIWLSVSDRNLRARSFYRKRRLRDCGRGPILVVGSDRLTSTVMSGRLARRRSAGAGADRPAS